MDLQLGIKGLFMIIAVILIAIYFWRTNKSDPDNSTPEETLKKEVLALKAVHKDFSNELNGIKDTRPTRVEIARILEVAKETRLHQEQIQQDFSKCTDGLEKKFNDFVFEMRSMHLNLKEHVSSLRPVHIHDYPQPEIPKAEKKNEKRKPKRKSR